MGGAQTAEVTHHYLLVGDGIGSDVGLVELGECSGFMKSGAHHLGRAQRAQMEFSGQRWIDYRDLGSGIEDEVVRAGMVNGDCHEHLVTVQDAEGNNCNIRRAVGSRGERWNHGCSKCR